MAGALAQASPDAAGAPDPYSERDRNLPPGWGRPLLDRATESLLADLTQRAPYEAEAAAMFSNVGRPNEAALGAGIGANLRTRLGMLQLPFQLSQVGARAGLEGAEAERYNLENEMLRRNFGYMTSPWDMGGEFSQPPAAGSSGHVGPPGPPGPTAPPPGGGGGPPPAGPPEATPAAGGPQVNPMQLPVTDESRAQLDYLGMQLHRAVHWAQTSPQARQDVGAILGQMTKIISEDPFAKNEMQHRQTQEASNIDLEKQLHLKAADMMQGSLADAHAELTALASSPNSQLNPAMLQDPEKVQAWVDARARQIFGQRYQALAQQIKAAGLDPNKFMGDAPVVAQPLAPPPSQRPSAAPVPDPGARLPDGTPLTDETGTPFQPPQAGPSEPVPQPRPSLVPDLPPLPPDRQGAVAAVVAQQPPPSPFVERQLTPEERVNLNKEQGEVGKTINMEAQWYGNLKDALKLNDKSYSGPLVEVYQQLARGRAALHELFTGKESFEPTLTMTATLNSIISTMNLQNIQTFVKGRMTNFELEYVTQLESAMDFSKQERAALFKRGLQIIGPRYQFEQLRAKALAAGKYIDPNSYEDWFSKAYGGKSPWDLTGADLGKSGGD